ncbi:MAG TPA: hypothetical protein P5556_08150 [Candidatus Gastranaerophilales bacterium]|nr:hypothetical protein [Candidatus Gastranaerophilales bacterium]
MRKGSSKILLILSILIFIGFTFLFLTKTNAQKNTTQEDAAVENLQKEITPDPNTDQVFTEKIDELKEIYQNLDVKNLDEFKKQTKQGLYTLADLINELSKSPDETTTTGTAQTRQVQKSAEALGIITNEKEIINQIKIAFNASKINLSDIKGKLNCQDKANREFCPKIDQKLNSIQQMITQINDQNYKAKTKEIFMQFHSVLEYMNQKMNRPDSLSSINDQENNQPELNVNKAQQDQKQAKTQDRIKQEQCNECEDDDCECEKDQEQKREQKQQQEQAQD